MAQETGQQGAKKAIKGLSRTRAGAKGAVCMGTQKYIHSNGDAPHHVRPLETRTGPSLEARRLVSQWTLGVARTRERLGNFSVKIAEGPGKVLAGCGGHAPVRGDQEGDIFPGIRSVASQILKAFCSGGSASA